MEKQNFPSCSSISSAKALQIIRQRVPTLLNQMDKAPLGLLKSFPKIDGPNIVRKILTSYLIGMYQCISFLDQSILPQYSLRWIMHKINARCAFDLPYITRRGSRTVKKQLQFHQKSVFKNPITRLLQAEKRSHVKRSMQR